MNDIFVKIFIGTNLSYPPFDKAASEFLFDLSLEFEGYLFFLLLVVILIPVLIYISLLINYYYDDKDIGYLVPFIERKNLAEENYVDLPVLEKAEKTEEDIVEKIAEAINIDPEKLRSYIGSEEVDKLRTLDIDNNASEEGCLNMGVERWLDAKEVITNSFEQTHEEIKEEKEKDNYDKAIRIALSDGEEISEILIKLLKSFGDVEDE